MYLYNIVSTLFCFERSRQPTGRLQMFLQESNDALQLITIHYVFPPLLWKKIEFRTKTQISRYTFRLVVWIGMIKSRGSYKKCNPSLISPLRFFIYASKLYFITMYVDAFMYVHADSHRGQKSSARVVHILNHWASCLAPSCMCGISSVILETLLWGNDMTKSLFPIFTSF